MALVLNSIIPIFSLIFLGAFLKRARLINDEFLAITDRLIYYIFFPALLFWKIGKPAPGALVNTDLLAAVLGGVFIVFLAGLAYALVIRMPNSMVGSFSQSCYRFSTYIGMAVVAGALGESGARDFGVIIGFVIPFINVLAVVSLTWFAGDHESGLDQAAALGKSIVSNPLIIACLSGLIYAKLELGFPTWLNNILSLMSTMSLPLALISIGGSLQFSLIREHLATSAIAGLFKLALLPLVGWWLLKEFDVTGSAFQTAMIYFALPTSPQNYILSAQLKSDLPLAASGLVVSTFMSIVSLSVILMLFCAG
jgi:malonate transporter and related proteins